MARQRTVSIPKDKYLGQVEVKDGKIHFELRPKQKVALLFICLNERYWSYLTQVIKDAKKNFLPHHQVDFFVWTDIHKYPEVVKSIFQRVEAIQGDTEEAVAKTMDLLIEVILRFQTYPATLGIVQAMEQQGFRFRREAGKMWMETGVDLSKPEKRTEAIAYAKSVLAAIIEQATNEVESLKGTCTLIEQEGAEWPIPTLMRYHLFLNEEERLKGYDYLFYLDSDMRIVTKISDEILGKGLTAAPHPGYAISKKMIPPYEPNPESAAYIHRLGYYVQEGIQKRFYPFYAAGGFQGGKTAKYLSAMKVMRKSIDKDFHHNYQAIWNDESHWNKYLWEYQRRGGIITFLDVSYIYPDSLIKEYYTPLWGKEYEAKIITLTKPFSLSPGALADLGILPNS